MNCSPISKTSIIINSGYHCPHLNAAVGGRKTIRHLKGKACDIHLSDMKKLREWFAYLMDGQFDQLIMERSTPTSTHYWIHVSCKRNGRNRQTYIPNLLKKMNSMNLPTLSQNQDPALRKLDRLIEQFIVIVIVSVVCLVCCSCGSTKVATQLVRDVRVDTVYLSNVQYDYIYKDHMSEHHHGTLPPTTSDGKYLETLMRTDTLYIKDVSVEYRYKLLKDTIRVVERDSIPYQVTVTEVKEITRPLTWFDHLTRAGFWLLVGAFGLYLIRLIIKLRRV